MRVLVALLSFVIAVDAYADCAGPRWPVKVATDGDAAAINTVAIPTTIPLLRSFPITRPLPQDRRVKPAETTTYSITATLTEYRLDEDGDAYLILADAEDGASLPRFRPSNAHAPAGSPSRSPLRDSRSMRVSR